ncbi:hypothetical protein ACFFRR_002111 [Megaselia abdita]
MSKRRRDTGSPFLQSLCEDETLTSFHKLLLNKFDSIISFLQRIDEKVYSIDKRLSYLELKDKESPEHDRKTERTESPPLPQNPPPVSINHPPVVIHNPVTVSPVQIPAESHHRPSISDLPSTSASAAISTTIIKEEFVDDDESSHSIMEIEDLQNLAAKSEAIEIEDVSYILPEGSLNDTNSSYTHHERESMDGHSHQVFPQGSFNCLEEDDNLDTSRSYDQEAPKGFVCFDRSLKILDIIKSSIKGKIVIEEFKQTGILTKALRKIIIHEIINFVCSNNMWLRKNDLIMIVHQIKAIFPGEKSEDYLRLPPKGKNISPLGALWNNWRYRSTQVKKDIQALKNNSMRSIPNKNPVLEQPHTSQAILTNKQWLSLNSDPWTIVSSKWADTILQRKEDIAFMDFNGFLEAWPLLRHQFGYTLLEIDFCYEYPDKSTKLLNYYECYISKIIGMAIAKSRKTNNTELIDELISKSKYNINVKDVKNIENLKALSALNYILPGDFEYMGIENIVGYLEIGERFQNKMDMNHTFPKIYILRDLRDIPTRFYVIYKTIAYSFDNFLPSLDMLMKMVLVLDIPYPSEAKTLLTFLQLFFYEIMSEKRKNTDSSIYTVVYELNAEKIRFF